MKTIYKKNPQDKPLIPNSIIEELFMMDATDEMMQVYTSKAQSSIPAVRASATAYASEKIRRIYKFRRDKCIREGEDTDYVQWRLWNK